jgi:ureidoglycolate lyase
MLEHRAIDPHDLVMPGLVRHPPFPLKGLGRRWTPGQARGDESSFAPGGAKEDMRELTPEVLTAEAFAPFGSVIEASDAAVRIDINQGHAVRYDRLADVDVGDGGGNPVISLFRAKPLGELVLRVFERHPLGSQSFVPLSGRPYLVAVAPAGVFDADAIRLFRVGGHQGVHYRKGTWHHFLLVLDEGSDFLVVDRAGPGDNCEEVALAPADHIHVRR